MWFFALQIRLELQINNVYLGSTYAKNLCQLEGSQMVSEQLSRIPLSYLNKGMEIVRKSQKHIYYIYMLRYK